MRLVTLHAVLAGTLSMVGMAEAKAVFAHYMVGTVTQQHAAQDIDDAKVMGIDGFALNVGDATQPFVSQALGYLFAHAEARGDFKLYISMDVYASGAACYAGSSSCHGPFDYQWIWDAHKGSSAYYQYKGQPLISTFSSGGFNNTEWIAWKLGLGNNMYFWPDFDETKGYYENAPGWWWYWGPICDGIFSWESAWPMRAGVGGAYPGDTHPDVTVIKGAIDQGKSYMMGLSSLQYKNSYGANVYRQGDHTLPKRMGEILDMATTNQSPDIVQILTWNDGPESHYIGNLWIEQNNDTQPWAYANQYDWDHRGWQPLFTSFIDAYKSGQDSLHMKPANGAVAVGTMWYKSIMPDTVVCANRNDGNTQDYYNPPDGFHNGTNSMYWAVVLDPVIGNVFPTYTLDLYSDGYLVFTQHLHGGLNFGWTPNKVDAGPQMIQLKNPAGDVIMTASGGLCVSTGCPDGIYNSNYQVIPLISGQEIQTCSVDRHDQEGRVHYELCGFDDTRDECIETPICDLNLEFSSLDSLQAASSGIPPSCIDIYALQVLGDMLDQALADYTDVNNGYDEKFGYYVTYVKEMVPTQLTSFMDSNGGAGNKYFSCVRHVDGGNTTAKQCPWEKYSLLEDYTVYYTLTDSAGFYNDTSVNLGMDPSWIRLDEYTFASTCAGQFCTNHHRVFYGYPMASKTINVPNPKDIVTKALTNIADLKDNILATRLDIMLGQWSGANNDVTQVFSMPVFMIIQAVDAMKQVKDIGATVEQSQKTNLILTILSAVLIFLPFVGEAAEVATGLASLGRIIALMSEAGNAALSIYDIVQDPKSAPMDIIGILMGGGSFRSAKGVSDLAAVRRGISSADIAKLGKLFKENDTKLQKIIKACSK